MFASRRRFGWLGEIARRRRLEKALELRNNVVDLVLIERLVTVVVDLRRRPQPAVDRSTLWELLETAYGQRRKMMRRSLATLLREQDFRAAEVAPESRPEQLELAAWVALAEAKIQL